MADKTKVRVGPGLLYAAPLGSDLPVDLTTPWATVDAAWAPLGYTDEGSEFSFEVNFEDVMVAERNEPVLILETSRNVGVTFALAELTAENLELAFNGGTVTAGTGIKTFEPPAPGDVSKIVLGWESDSGAERWVFKQCLQTGTVSLARRRAPDKASISAEFRCEVPDDDSPVFKAIISDTISN